MPTSELVEWEIYEELYGSLGQERHDQNIGWLAMHIRAQYADPDNGPVTWSEALPKHGRPAEGPKAEPEPEEDDERPTEYRPYYGESGA